MMSMQVQLSTFMYIVYSNKQIGYGSGHGYPEDHQKMDLLVCQDTRTRSKVNDI